jgi:hypothetical protein
MLDGFVIYRALKGNEMKWAILNVGQIQSRAVQI